MLHFRAAYLQCDDGDNDLGDENSSAAKLVAVRERSIPLSVTAEFVRNEIS